MNTMINDMLHLNIMVKHFTGNRLQAMVQLDMIYKINSKYMKGEKSGIIIVLDHKQEVLGMSFCEGQVEYFGKKWMDLVGLMEF